MKNLGENIGKNLENIKNSINNTMDNLKEAQNKFLQTNLGKAINGGIDLGLRIILPNCVEDEVIAVKDSLITEGFSAAVETAIEEATNLGKSAMGIVTGTFDNISQVKKAIKSGGLIDAVSDLIDSAIDWSKKHGYIKKGTSLTIKKGKNTIMKTIKQGVDNSLENQVEAIEKIDGYISKWYKYYEEKNFQNMEYQYNKIEQNLQKILPIEDILKKARVIENLHELIKNNGNNFELSKQEQELAEMLAN